MSQIIERAAAVLLVTKDLKSIWLAKRASSAKWFPDHWECPAGKIEEGESPEECAVREVREEAGLTLNLSQLRSVATVMFDLDRRTTACMELFIGVVLQGVPSNPEPHKRSDWELVPGHYTDMVCWEPMSPATAVLHQLHRSNMKALKYR